MSKKAAKKPPARVEAHLEDGRTIAVEGPIEALDEMVASMLRLVRIASGLEAAE